MSTPPSESKPSPWLVMAMPFVFTLLGFSAQWGMRGADVSHLDRRITTTEVEVARVSSVQFSAATQSARVEERMEGMTRELARLTSAVERLSGASPPSVSARSVP